MTFDINKLKNIANEAAKTSSVDMSESSSGGGAAQTWPVGNYRGRIVEVVEFGMQPQEYQGERKAPSRELRLGVMLFPNKRVKELYGEDVAPKVVRSRDIKVSNNSRAGAKAIFDRLNVGGDATNFAQFIGDAYKFKLDDYVSKAGRKSQVIDWSVTSAAIDDDTGKPLSVPEAPEAAYTMFLFDQPSKEMWDKLHIPGVTEQGKSKNFIQEKILAALDYKGSALEALLRGTVLPEPQGALVEQEDFAGEDDIPEMPEPPTVDDEY